MTTYSFRAPPDVQRIVEAALAAREGEPAAGRHGVTGSRAAVICDLVRAGADVTGPDGRAVEPEWHSVGTDDMPSFRLKIGSGRANLWWSEGWYLMCLPLDVECDTSGALTHDDAKAWALGILRERALEILEAVGLPWGEP